MALVDWDLATSTAARLGPLGPKVTFDEATSVVAELRLLADEAVEHVSAYTGLSVQVTDAPVRVVDRKSWAAINIDGLRTVLTPLTEQLAGKVGPLGENVGSKVTGVQAGAVLGYLSGKVLGQYEVFTQPDLPGVAPGQLLLVAPNIVAVERRMGADPRDFRLWVCLHEVTHRTQFTAVPWLREHFLSEVREFVAASETPNLDPGKLIQQAKRGLSVAVEAAKAAGSDGGTSLLDVVQTPAQRAVLDRLTALLTLLEGHAEVVMDGVGPKVIPSVARIRAAFDRRRAGGNPAERYLRRLLGIDIKLKQYAEGRRFVQQVLDRVDMAGLNQVWQSPETLPRLAELTAPEDWIARVVR